MIFFVSGLISKTIAIEAQKDLVLFCLGLLLDWCFVVTMNAELLRLFRLLLWRGPQIAFSKVRKIVMVSFLSYYTVAS